MSRWRKRNGWGLTTIVIDHHQADETLPPALAVINPNRLDDLSQLGYLAAVGLAFMVVVAVNRELRRRGFWAAPRGEPDLLGLLDLVALGTVADVVPLKGLNRAFVAKGLLALRRRDNVGLTALMDIARLGGPPEPWHLGFLLGPRINAGGRIGRAGLGVDLMLEADPIEAERLAAELDRLNRERQVIEAAALAQAEAEAMAALGLGGARCRRGHRRPRVGIRAWSAWSRPGSRSGSAGRPSRSRSGRAASAPARAARSRASISAARCARPCARGFCSRAAAMPWRPG